MASKSRPAGGRPPRSGSKPRAGVGPGPAYRPSSSGGGTSHKGGDCCPMAAAARSARRGRFNAARRYFRLGLRSLAARVA